MATGTFSIAATLVTRHVSSSAPIKRALVQQLRSSAALKAEIPGGIHEGFAPDRAQYPFLTYQLVYAPIRRQWGSQQYITGFDLRIFSGDSVEANNVDALVLDVLNDAALVVDGQTTLLCHRVADFSVPDVDEEGRKVYIVGGTYEVWTDLPRS
jgi:hypothetical protein